jgi:hypothetical protein
MRLRQTFLPSVCFFVWSMYHLFNLISCVLQNLQQENAELQAAVSLAQAQLETALSAQESQKRVLETLNAQLATRLQELAGIHREIATALQT